MTTVEHAPSTQPPRRPAGFRPSPTPRATEPASGPDEPETRAVGVVPLAGAIGATIATRDATAGPEAPSAATPAAPPAERATVAVPAPDNTTVAVPAPDNTTVAVPAPDSATVAVAAPDGATVVVPAREGTTVAVPRPGTRPQAAPPAGAGSVATRQPDAPAAATVVGTRQPACPVTGHGRSGGHPPPAGVPDERAPEPVDPAAAEAFLRQVYAETEPEVPLAERLRQVRTEIDRTGLYSHTTHELVFGTRIAWRNSARCIGRLYWKSLQVRDLRRLHDPADVAQESVGHLRAAGRDGRIRPTMTVFAPDAPGRPGPRIRNDQLIRYAGHRNPDGSVTGDPAQADFTDHVVALGWPRPQPRGRFDVLPLLITGSDGRSRLFDVPPDAVHEVPLRHPDHPWFAQLGLRWHSVPAISNMPLEIGGVTYPAVPFNGWYLDTEIGARNFADTDRYDLLPEIARRLGLDTRSVRTLWKDRAMVELTRAVTFSFDADGVTMADHHTEAERFLTHLAREEAAGRSCPADWSWIVPPMSGSQTPVFHRYYAEPDPQQRPAFLEPHRVA